jgi:hypothetical protein
VVVLVRDGYGNPVGGANVSFLPVPGAGTATPATARTDSLGQARTVWTLGGREEGQAMTVRLDSLHQIRVRARALRAPGFSVATAPVYEGPASWGGQWNTSAGAVGAAYLSRLPLPELGCWHNALGPVPLLGSGPVRDTGAEAAEGGLPGCQEESAEF